MNLYFSFLVWLGMGCSSSQELNDICNQPGNLICLNQGAVCGSSVEPGNTVLFYNDCRWAPDFVERCGKAIAKPRQLRVGFLMEQGQTVYPCGSENCDDALKEFLSNKCD